MSCSEWQSRVESYVDAELSPPETDAFRAHLATCPDCAAIALAAMKSKTAVRRAGNCYAAPPELRAKIFDLARSQPEQSSNAAERGRKLHASTTLRYWPRWTFATAALLLLAAGLFVAVNRRQSARALAEFADLHVTALASANPVEIVSTDRHTVKPWFQGRIPFTFDLPELQGTPFTLVGGRVAYFHQEPGAHLIFGYQRHLISVFIFRDTPQLAIPASLLADKTSSFTLRTWTNEGLRYVVLGDASAATIDGLSNLLQRIR
jgi:anti-sigma factor (TIGR02949 family)